MIKSISVGRYHIFSPDKNSGNDTGRLKYDDGNYDMQIIGENKVHTL